MGGCAPVGALSSKGTQARVRRVVPVLFVGAYFGGSRAVGEGDGDCLARGVGCLYRESSRCYGNALIGRYSGCLGCAQSDARGTGVGGGVFLAGAG